MADRCAHSETLPNQQEPPHAGLSLPAYENTLSIPPDDRFFSPPIIEMIPFLYVVRALARTHNIQKRVLQLVVAAGDPPVRGIAPTV